MSSIDSGVQQLSRNMPHSLGFPGGTSGKESTCKGDTRDMGLISGRGRFRGGGNDSPLQYFFLERSMDRGILQATVHGVIKSQTQLCRHTLDIQTAEKRGWLHISQSPEYARKYLIKEGKNVCFKGKRMLILILIQQLKQKCHEPLIYNKWGARDWEGLTQRVTQESCWHSIRVKSRYIFV